MSSAVHQYKKYLKIVTSYHRLFTVTCLVIMTLVALTSYLLPRKFVASSVVFVEKNIVNDLVQGLAPTTTLDDSVRVLTYALNSRPLMLKVLNELDVNLKSRSDIDIENMIKNYQKDTVVQIKDKDLFIVSFKHADPRFARDYVNLLVRSYIAQYSAGRREQTMEASKFLSSQIENFKDKVDKSDDALAQFKASKGGIANLDESTLMQEISTAQQKLYELQLKRKTLEGQLSYARIGGNPLQQKLASLQKRLDELRVDFTEQYPEIQSVKAQIESVKEELKSKTHRVAAPMITQETMQIEAELNALRETERNLNQFIAKNQHILESIPAAKATLEKLESDKDTQKKMYDSLFSRYDQSEVAKEMQLHDRTAVFRIVDPAYTPIRPTSPNRIKIMLMGVVAGLAGGAALVTIIDLFDQSIKTSFDLNGFGFPVLAVIPVYKTASQMLIELKKIRRFYFISGGYLLILLVFFIMELLEMEYMDIMLNTIGLPALVQRFFLT